MYKIKDKIQSVSVSVLSLIFALAALGKTLGLSAAHEYILKYLNTSHSASWVLLLILLFAEYVCSLTLQFRRYRNIGLLIAIILTYSFVVFELFLPQSQCPCFGPIATHVPFLMNGGLMLKFPIFAIAILVAYSHTSQVYHFKS